MTTVLAPETKVFYGIIEKHWNDTVGYYVLPATEAVDAYLFDDNVLVANYDLLNELVLLSGKNAETIVGVLDLNNTGTDYSAQEDQMHSHPVMNSVIRQHKIAALKWFAREIPYEEQDNWEWLFFPYHISKTFVLATSRLPERLVDADLVWEHLEKHEGVGGGDALEEVSEHQPHHEGHGLLEVWDHGHQEKVVDLQED